MTCAFDSEWGVCQQPAEDGKLCPFHREMVTNPDFHVDRYYHEKIVKGLTAPTVTYISQVEMDALMRGRQRLDGRRLDQWIVT